MKAAWISVLVFAIAAPLGAETIAKWRTPDGGLHLGDRPPPGSVLLEAVELPDPAPVTVEEAAAREDLRAKAAADGREIMRRRAEARRALREEAAERLARTLEAEERPSDTVVVLQRGVPFGMEDCFDPVFGWYRPKPEPPPAPQPPPALPPKLSPRPKALGAVKGMLLSAR